MFRDGMSTIRGNDNQARSGCVPALVVAARGAGSQQCRPARTGQWRHRAGCVPGVHGSGGCRGGPAVGGQGPVGEHRQRAGQQRGAGGDKGDLPAGHAAHDHGVGHRMDRGRDRR